MPVQSSPGEEKRPWDKPSVLQVKLGWLNVADDTAILLCHHTIIDVHHHGGMTEIPAVWHLSWIILNRSNT